MDDQITGIIGWLGFALVSMGYYFNAKKKLYCFFIWGIGNAIYILYGFIISAPPIIAMSVFVLGMNIYGDLNWVKDSQGTDYEPYSPIINWPGLGKTRFKYLSFSE